MSAKISHEFIEQRVGDILVDLRARFPKVAFEVINDSLPGRIDAVLRILGQPNAAAAANAAAQDLTSELWEKSGIYVEVRGSQEIWCRKSGDIVQDMGPLAPGQEPPRMIVVDFDNRGVMFVCYPSDNHTEHDFGDVRPQR